MRAMDDSALVFWPSAILTGLVFGYVIQRGGFCFTRAISNVALMGDAGIMRAYVLALLVAVIGTHLLLPRGWCRSRCGPFAGSRT